jgi:TolB-like protein
VIGWPSVQGYRGGEKSPRQIATALRADLLMLVSVREEGGAHRITAFLLDGRTERKLWVGDYPGRELRTPEQVASAARHVAEEFDAKRNKFF